MKKIVILLLIVFSLINCNRNLNKDINGSQTNNIVIGKVDSLYSNLLDESRKIWVYVPENFKNERKEKKYPVLFLLDGPVHFYAVTGMIRQLSSISGINLLPEMIVVALPNTNRSRDLTPTHVDIDFFSGDSISYESGGGDKFLDFIAVELIPYIEKNYPASTYRTFIGHSFGGLCVINALIKKPHLFDNYIAIDPSLWWDNLAFKDYADSVLTNGNFENKALYVAIANTMKEGMNIQSVRSDTMLQTAHIRSILQFVNSLDDVNLNGLDFKWKYYKEDTHGSVPLVAEYDGFRSLFRWHRFTGMNKIVHSASDMTSEELLELPTVHFKGISNRFGYEVLPPEMLINSIGYLLLNRGMPEKALVFFDLNVKNYPESWNVYDSRGDCYLAQNDTVKALEFYNKASKLKGDDKYHEKIDNLEESMKN